MNRASGQKHFCDGPWTKSNDTVLNGGWPWLCAAIRTMNEHNWWVSERHVLFSGHWKRSETLLSPGFSTERTQRHICPHHQVYSPRLPLMPLTCFVLNLAQWDCFSWVYPRFSWLLRSAKGCFWKKKSVLVNWNRRLRSRCLWCSGC